MKTIIDRDEKGRATHVRWYDGDEHWYDADGNTTHVRLSDGDERWYDYDAGGHITHSRLGNGAEFWYDAAGRLTKWKDKNGILHTN